MRTQLLMIRHGEARAARASSDRVEGIDEDAGLSGKGRRQADALAHHLARHGTPDLLYSSPLLRAIQTAEPLAFETGLEVRVEEDLAELRIGYPRGLAEDAACAGWERARADVETPAFAGGETFRELSERAARCLDRLVADHPGARVAAVCHGGVIEVTLLRVLGIPLARAPEIWIEASHTGILRLEFAGDGGPTRVLAVNETAHLLGLE